MDKKTAKNLKAGKKRCNGRRIFISRYNYYDYIKKPPEMGMSEANHLELWLII